MNEIIKFEPFPKQAIALACKAYEILFGGARGPGKTATGIVWLLKLCGVYGARALVIRRNAIDLYDWVDRAWEIFKDFGAKKTGNSKSQVIFEFPNNYKIITGHLKDKDAYTKYQGHEYQRILIEELTLIPNESDYVKLISSCRSTISGIEPSIFCTTNPTGKGAAWVKKRWKIRDGLKPFYTRDERSNRTRAFIPARVTDNPVLMKEDPGYLDYLLSLPEKLKDAWYYGRWDSMMGGYFEGFEHKITVYNDRDVKIDDKWPRFMSVDWGYSSPMAVYWHAVAPDQFVYTYREWYKTKKLDIDAATETLQISLANNELIHHAVGDPVSFPMMGTQKIINGKLIPVSRREIWEEVGIPMIMGNNSRILGWNVMREYMQPRDYQGKLESKWKISSSCTNLLNEIENATHAENDPEDIEKINDHGLDSCRLFLMSRPPIYQINRDPRLMKLEERIRRGYAVESFDQLIM